MKPILLTRALAATTISPTILAQTSPTIGILPNNSTITLLFSSNPPSSPSSSQPPVPATSSSPSTFTITLTATNTLSQTPPPQPYINVTSYITLSLTVATPPATAQPISSNPPLSNSTSNALPTPSSASSTLSSSPAATALTGGSIHPSQIPAQPGLPANCDTWMLVTAGSDCIDLASKAGISLGEFMAWNPAVGTGCGSLEAGGYACVGVSGGVGNGTVVRKWT